MSQLLIQPITKDQANDFVDSFHRHNERRGRIRGHTMRDRVFEKFLRVLIEMGAITDDGRPLNPELAVRLIVKTWEFYYP